MSQPYIGEVRIFGFSYAPYGWALCNGQILPISQYSALFSIIGTSFGGNGTSNFALPNLRGSVAIASGSGVGLTPRSIGDQVGQASVTLDSTQIPAHTHSLQAANPNDPAARSGTPSASVWLGQSPTGAAYVSTGTPNVPFSPNAISTQGGNQPHSNVQPVTAMNFCIALTGVFPTRN